MTSPSPVDLVPTLEKKWGKDKAYAKLSRLIAIPELDLERDQQTYGTGRVAGKSWGGGGFRSWGGSGGRSGKGEERVSLRSTRAGGEGGGRSGGGGGGGRY